jgi:hypothetical protein
MTSRNLFSFCVPHCLQWSLWLPPPSLVSVFAFYAKILHLLLFYNFTKNTIIPASRQQNSLANTYPQTRQFPHSCFCERLNIPTIGLHILLQENSACGPILVIYISLTDTRMWKFGLRPRSSFSGNT